MVYRSENFISQKECYECAQTWLMLRGHKEFDTVYYSKLYKGLIICNTEDKDEDDIYIINWDEYKKKFKEFAKTRVTILVTGNHLYKLVNDMGTRGLL